MKRLDCSAMDCPLPVVTCKEALEKENLSHLEVLVSHKAGVENVTRFLEKSGFSVTFEDRSASGTELYALLAEKKVGALVESAKPTPVKTPKENHEEKTLVFLSSACIGLGDDELGAKLMASFISCLSDLNPWQVILVNGAVKLSTQEGSILEHLQNLEKNGTQIYVCGTCLNHYGIFDDKKVGESTNMMDIVSAMSVADKIIKL